jgi:hypothetical protein
VPVIYNALEGINGLICLLGSDTIVEKDALKTLYKAYSDAFSNRDGVCNLLMNYTKIHSASTLLDIVIQ